MSTHGGNHFGDGEEAGFKNEIDFHVLLQDATHPEVADALAEAVDHLDFHFDDSKGGSLNLSFLDMATLTATLLSKTGHCQLIN
jgi:hypothetical protein